MREELAAAATIEGVTNITKFYRQSLKVGDGFVRFVNRTRDDSGFGWINEFEIWLAVPQEIVAGEIWIETNLPALLEAISEVAEVTEARPRELGLESNSFSGLIIAVSAAE